MKTYTHFLLLVIVIFASCKTPYEAISSSAKKYKIEKSENDTLTSIELYLKPYRDSLDKRMNEVIGMAESDFIKEKPSGSLGLLVVDAMFEKAKELNASSCNAICNFGGIRIPEIKKGPVTTGKVFELLPFDNELVLLAVKGSILQQWISFIDSAGGWPIRKQMKFQTNQNNQVYYSDTTYVESKMGEMTLLIQQSFVNPDSIYIVATNDYIANGGDNCSFLKPCKRVNTGVLIRDLMIAYIQKHKVLYRVGYYTTHE
jgi:2',3'-cyclic-nucleotide 2'-phosphodiesterase (5'-nucleotidase family)